MNTRICILSLVMVMTLRVIAGDANDGPAQQPTNTMKIKLTIQEKTMAATLTDNPTTRDFASLLPLTLTMKDLFGREKYGHLPRAISDAGKRQFTYEVGQIIYWSPGPDLAIYYRADGQRIPSPGIIVIGKIDSDIEALSFSGPVKVKFERSEVP